MAENDYALVVGINRYPGLGADLEGPANDAAKFRAWLLDASQGNVPEDNIALLNTPRFHPPGPTSYLDAHPTSSEFLGYFTHLLGRQQEAGTGKPGRRLYLYLSGHGFQGKALHDIALYSAMSVKNPASYDHIAGSRYCESIRQNGWFEEVVLIMDCCRDLELTKMVAEPSLRQYASAGAASKKVYKAFASSYGQKAKEAKLPNGEIGGIFTYLFLEALAKAEPEPSGDVTAKRVTDYLFNLWDQHPLAKGLSRPEIPGGTEVPLIWYQRASAVGPLPPNVRMLVPGAADGSIVIFLKDPYPYIEVARAVTEQQVCWAHLSPGLHKAVLDGTVRTKVFEVKEGGADEQFGA